MKFTFNDQVIKNTIMDEGKALALHYLFDKSQREPLQLYFRLIKDIVAINSFDTFSNHLWSFFDISQIIWQPRLLFLSNNSIITSNTQTLITSSKGTIEGICLTTNTTLFSVGQLPKPQLVDINDQIELTYTLDW